MNTIERFRSQLLGCGVLEDDAAATARRYGRALFTWETADWHAFYHSVYESLQRLCQRTESVTFFARVERADILLLLNDDLGRELFGASDVADLERDLLHPNEAVAS